MTQRLAIVAALAAAAFKPFPASADGIIDLWEQNLPAFQNPTLFPNWVRAPTASFMLYECDDVLCGNTTSNFTGLTVFNAGTAAGGGGGDLTAVLYEMNCGAWSSGFVTMTWAGLWAGEPTWTWAGSIALTDACSNCGCGINLNLYTNIAPCPVEGRTVQLGIDAYAATDNIFYSGPTAEVKGPVKTIRYTMKSADRAEAAPGDTVTYTIWYGRPGTTTLTTLWITDTVPQYTHYLPGGGAPLPDAGWDPNAGPPSVLRWSIAGSFPTAGGPTGQITFRATVDWGNEPTDTDSGFVAAPEGQFIFNRIHYSWDPQTTCASGVTSNAPSLVVKRFFFFMLGDNDVLYAPRVGQPDDEIIYTMFARNISTTKTWWNVQFWDTVPPELDVWSGAYGMEDPCVGWTMTPSGCAGASPGRIVAGGATLLTWRLDMPPSSTITLRWKARVVPTASVGATALNRVSLLAFGKTGIAEGTGHSTFPRPFMHEAPLILRTTYISYVGLAGESTAWFSCASHTYYLSFYSLNKAGDFALYKKWCCASAPCDTSCAAFAAVGGVSPTISDFAGSCTGGPLADWEVGCKVERSPARFTPGYFAAGIAPPTPFSFVHKLVSNAPVIWELSMCFEGGGQDTITFAGASNLSYVGLMYYTYPRMTVYPNRVDSLYIANTDENTDTSVFIFDWNAATLQWNFVVTQDIYRESQWVWVPPVTNHYRVMSSAGRLIVSKAVPGIGMGGWFNDFGAVYPNKENGNLVNATDPATFYFWAPASTNNTAAIFGNVGATSASVGIWRYTPLNPTLPPPSANVTVDLVDSAGSWAPVGSTVVPAGLATAGNPRVYGASYLTGVFTGTYAFYKGIVTGGNIMVWTGNNIFDEFSGGTMLHSSNPMGDQVGQEFWVHVASDTKNDTCGGNNHAIQVFNIYSPKYNLAARLVSSNGYSAVYTTTGQDQAISFKSITLPAGGGVRNYRVNVLPGGNPGDVLAQIINCNTLEKQYLAPFLRRGVFYTMIAPPIAYIGQSFWITVVVTDSGGGTKTDYCGTTSFTSTDPGAKIEGSLMDSYNFTWTSNTGPCSAAPDENGVKVFVNVSLTRLGLISIVASDIVDGSITGLTTIMVVGADVKLFKEPRLSVAASSDTVQFKICWSNYSSASAFSFTMTDAVPMGTTFLPEAGTWGFDCRSTDAVGILTSYSTATTATMPAPASFTTGLPIATTRWLRWTVPMAGIQTTGCACFRVTVN